MKSSILYAFVLINVIDWRHRRGAAQACWEERHDAFSIFPGKLTLCTAGPKLTESETRGLKKEKYDMDYPQSKPGREKWRDRCG